MKKSTIVFFIALMVLVGSCSNLFEHLHTTKTGNDNISTNKGTSAEKHLDAGLVVQTPNDADHPENRIDFNPKTKKYIINSLSTDDSPFKFTCRPEDKNATVTYKAWRTTDRNGNKLSKDKWTQISMDSVKKTSDGTVATLSSASDPDNHLYGTIKVIATITADDPQFSTEYEIDLVREEDAELDATLESLTVTPHNNTAGVTTVLKKTPSGATEAEKKKNIENYKARHFEYRIDADEDADYLNIDVKPYDGADVEWKIFEKNNPTAIKTGTTDSFKVPNLGKGYYKVKIKVTEDSTVKTYVLDVFRPRANLASLRSLTFEPSVGFNNGVGKLNPNPDIEKDDDNYEMWLSSYDDKNITELTLKPVPGNKRATIKKYKILSPASGPTISDPDSDGYGKISNLPDGDTKVKIFVESQDKSKTGEHILTIHKAPANAATLHSIKVKTQQNSHLTEIDKASTVVGTALTDSNFYSPHADKNVALAHGSYLLKQETTTATITVIPFNEGATISASADNGARVATNNRTFDISNLQDGDTTVTITVSPKDGSASRPFTVIFKKPDNKNADIREMKIEGSSYKPYPNNIPTSRLIYVTARTNQLNMAVLRFEHNGAKIKNCTAVKTKNVDGTNATGTTDVPCTYDADEKTAVFGSGNSLPVGTTKVTLTTVAPNGSTTKDYTFTIVRPDDKETRLKAFGANGGFGGFDRDTDFDTDNHTYKKSIQKPSSVKFYANAIHANSSITLTVTNNNVSPAVSETKTGTGSVAITLSGTPETSKHPYVVEAVVTDDGATRTYKGEVILYASKDARLKKLTVEQGSGTGTKDRELTPKFVANKTTTSYSARANVALMYNVPLKITVAPTDSQATLTGGTVTSNGGTFTSSNATWSNGVLTIKNYAKAKELTIPFTVTPQSGEDDKKDYTLTIKVPELLEATYGTDTIFSKTYKVGSASGTTKKMAYRFGSELSKSGAAPEDTGGLDIVGSKDGSTWCDTSSAEGGWHYKLKTSSKDGWVNIPETYNGSDYIEERETGLKFKVGVKIIFVDKAPYAEITHTVKNESGAAITGVAIGAASDVEINGKDNDADKLTVKRLDHYGVKMNDAQYTFGIYCQHSEWKNQWQSVSTFWAGQFGWEDDNVFTNISINDPLKDDAVAYSWTIGDLADGAEATRTIRISLGLLGE